jgi:hypothetical protein
MYVYADAITAKPSVLYSVLMTKATRGTMLASPQKPAEPPWGCTPKHQVFLMRKVAAWGADIAPVLSGLGRERWALKPASKLLSVQYPCYPIDMDRISSIPDSSNVAVI